jgi:hypothetical protein
VGLVHVAHVLMEKTANFTNVMDEAEDTGTKAVAKLKATVGSPPMTVNKMATSLGVHADRLRLNQVEGPQCIRKFIRARLPFPLSVSTMRAPRDR